MCEVSKFDSDSKYKLGELNRNLLSLDESVSRIAAGAASIVAFAAIIVLLKLGVESGGAAKAAMIFLIAAALFCLADLLVLDYL